MHLLYFSAMKYCVWYILLSRRIQKSRERIRGFTIFVNPSSWKTLLTLQKYAFSMNWSRLSCEILRLIHLCSSGNSSKYCSWNVWYSYCNCAKKQPQRKISAAEPTATWTELVGTLRNILPVRRVITILKQIFLFYNLYFKCYTFYWFDYILI